MALDKVLNQREERTRRLSLSPSLLGRSNSLFSLGAARGKLSAARLTKRVLSSGGWRSLTRLTNHIFGSLSEELSLSPAIIHGLIAPFLKSEGIGAGSGLGKDHIINRPALSLTTGAV
jgi:hypothetical protein